MGNSERMVIVYEGKVASDDVLAGKIAAAIVRESGRQHEQGSFYVRSVTLSRRAVVLKLDRILEGSAGDFRCQEAKVLFGAVVRDVVATHRRDSRNQSVGDGIAGDSEKPA